MRGVRRKNAYGCRGPSAQVAEKRVRPAKVDRVTADRKARARAAAQSRLSSGRIYRDDDRLDVVQQAVQ